MSKLLVFLLCSIPVPLFAQHPFCSFREAASVFPFSGRTTEDSTRVLRIPVVVHVLHLKDPVGSSNNPTETTIREVLDFINKTYRAQWSSYPDTLRGGTDTKIEFVLAAKDRDGRPFNGIDRIDASGNRGYRDSARVRRELLLETMWDKYRYGNIWLVNRIEGGGSGFAAPPEPANAPVFNYEGAVIVSSVFKTGNPIAVHELGHYLGLAHTWGNAFGTNCIAETNCNSGGDHLCDTEPHFEKASCNLVGSINPCTGLPYGNTLHNFMSYADYACLDRFTRDQRQWIRNTILSLRSGVVNNELTRQEPVSLRELGKMTITPNPNEGAFTIRFLAPVSGKLSLLITHADGGVIHREIREATNIREWPVSLKNVQSGIHIIRVADKSGSLTVKAWIK